MLRLLAAPLFFVPRCLFPHAADPTLVCRDMVFTIVLRSLRLELGMAVGALPTPAGGVPLVTRSCVWPLYAILTHMALDSGTLVWGIHSTRGSPHTLALHGVCVGATHHMTCRGHHTHEHTTHCTHCTNWDLLCCWGVCSGTPPWT